MKKTKGTGLLAQLGRSHGRTSTTHRDELIESAVKARKILKSETKRYREMYDRDPVGTQQLLAKLTPGPPLKGEVARPEGTGLFPELNN
jgi:hypothetical protein